MTCLYRAQGIGGFWPRLGALFIDEWFAPSVHVAHAAGSRRFGFGATLALVVRRSRESAALRRSRIPRRRLLARRTRARARPSHSALRRDGRHRRHRPRLHDVVAPRNALAAHDSLSESARLCVPLHHVHVTVAACRRPARAGIVRSRQRALYPLAAMAMTLSTSLGLVSRASCCTGAARATGALSGATFRSCRCATPCWPAMARRCIRLDRVVARRARARRHRLRRHARGS